MSFLSSLAKHFHTQRQPLALLLLQSFSWVVGQMDRFKALPNDGAKYLLFVNGMNPRPPQELLGITAGWLNAVAYEGLLDGKPVSSYTEAPAGAVFTWAHSVPPAYYVPLATTADSRSSLVGYLTQMSQESSYLRGLGLTAEAIAETAAKA